MKALGSDRSRRAVEQRLKLVPILIRDTTL